MGIDYQLMITDAPLDAFTQPDARSSSDLAIDHPITDGVNNEGKNALWIGI